MNQKFLPAIERFFQFALLGLVASGYLAIAGSGYVDPPTVILAGIGLLWRAAIVSGAWRLQVAERTVTVATIAYMLFAPLDYFLLSRSWIIATVHVVFFVASVKTLTARVARDYLFVSAVAFIELLAAALFSASGTFFLCLAAYLLCAVAALSASEVRRLGRAEYIIADTRRMHAPARLGGLAVVMTLGVLVLTTGLFFLLPRTANAALRFLASNRYHLTGFSNDVTLGEVGELKSDSRPVMHVRSIDGAAAASGRSAEIPANLKWRGLALERFDGMRWSTDPRSFRRVAADRAGMVQVADDWQRRRPGKRIFYRVDIQNVDADAIFVAGLPEFLNAGGSRILRAGTGSFRFGYPTGDTVRYEVYSYLGPGERQPSSQMGASQTALSPAERTEDLQLPRIDPRVRQLAIAMTAGAHGDGERAARLEVRLRNGYRYSLELPSTPPRDPIANFLFERRTGYCEHFASAMTVMLRSIGIPARLVNGFQSGIPNPYSGALVIRASDAHTWVEAFIPDAGWTVFDPTPLAGRIPTQTMWTRLALYLDAADTFWRDWVLSYDLGQQLTLASRVQLGARSLRENGWSVGIDWLRGLVRSTEEFASDRRVWRACGVIFGGLALLTLLLLLARRGRPVFARRRGRQGQFAASEATALYTNMLRLLRVRGYQKPPWFTPQEFAHTVEGEEELTSFTAAYYAVRFGGDTSAAEEMTRSLGALTRFKRSRL